MKLLEGTISLESRLGEGSKFIVSIPVGTVSGGGGRKLRPAEAALPAACGGVKALLIDDDPLQLEMTAAMCRQAGVGAECCQYPEYAAKLVAEGGFDVVLTDIQMPSADGFSVLAAVRGVNPALPVVAVSARGELEAGDFSDRGFAGCLRKPFTANELIAVLDVVCGAGKARSAGDTEGAEKSGAAGTVVGAGEPVSAGRHVGERGADGAADNAAVVSEDGVNFGPLTAYAGDDAEAARGILESFAEQSAANCRLLERALESGDVAVLRAVAHKMLPIFTMLGAAGVAATLRTAESWEGPLTDALCGEIGAAAENIRAIVAEAQKRYLCPEYGTDFNHRRRYHLRPDAQDVALEKGLPDRDGGERRGGPYGARGGRILARAERYAPARRGRHRPAAVDVRAAYGDSGDRDDELRRDTERRALHEARRAGLRGQAGQSRRTAEKIREALDVPAAGSEKPPVPAASAKKPREERPNYIEGRSDAAQRLYEYVRLVAPTNMSVLVTGASGTGKEHVAQLIHRESRRAGKPFVAVDCGAIGRELAASEFFGHVKGSFTGAVGDKTGAFEAANGGTLFLDEVGNLTYETQVQLLRALQERRIRPVGGSREIPVDIRLIAATNEDLEAAIARGAFRADLYHRINEFTLRMPELRQMRGDIMLFADFFLDAANRELDKRIVGFDPQAAAAMTRYDWPGNLRQMKNAVMSATLLCTGDYITCRELPAELSEAPETPAVPLRNPAGEEEQIRRALAMAGGNKSQAAKLLGIDRKTLYNKLHLYGIE